MSRDSEKRKPLKPKLTTLQPESKESSEKEESVNPYSMMDAYQSALEKNRRHQASLKSGKVKRTR
jgi:hypothetical protein